MHRRSIDRISGRSFKVAFVVLKLKCEEGRISDGPPGAIFVRRGVRSPPSITGIPAYEISILGHRYTGRYVTGILVVSSRPVAACRLLRHLSPPSSWPGRRQPPALRNRHRQPLKHRHRPGLNLPPSRPGLRRCGSGDDHRRLYRNCLRPHLPLPRPQRNHPRRHALRRPPRPEKSRMRLNLPTCRAPRQTRPGE